MENLNSNLRSKINEKNRARLKNKDFSILSSNCNGGVMLHDLGLRFNSPFINLYLKPKDFIKYCSNISHYISCDLKFIDNDKYPIAYLDDVEIRFLHYTSNKEAEEKWISRTKRINLDNLFIVMTERDGCTYDDLLSFDALPIENKVVFTHKYYPDIKSSIYIPGFEDNEHVGVLLDFIGESGERYYDYFNYVDWFNGVKLSELKSGEMSEMFKMFLSEKNKTTPNKKAINKINLLHIDNNRLLFIEGLNYIEGFNSPDYTYLIKNLKIINLATNTEFEYPLGTVPKKEMSNTLYGDKYFDYTAAGTATMGFKGIDVNHLEEGLYEVQISVSENKEERNYQSINFAAGHLDKYAPDDYFEYRLFKNQNKIYLAKRKLIGRNPISDYFISIEKEWIKEKTMHIEGAFVIPGIDITEFNQARYYLIAQKAITQKQYSFALGQIKKAGLGEKINNPQGSYNACYYATKMLKGIDMSALEFGFYDLYISLSYKSEVFTVKLNKQLEIGHQLLKLVDNIEE